MTEPVVVEVLAGARDEARAVTLRRLLLRCELLAFDTVADFDTAARIHRRCRAAGITPRGLVDCMIAAVAERLDAGLLAADAHLARIARVVGIRLDAASTPGA